MKISEAAKKIFTEETLSVEMMRNPAKLSEWVIWIREPLGKSYLLVNDDDSVVATADVNQAFVLLKSLGIKSIGVIL